MDVNSKVVFNVKGKAVLEMLRKHNADALLNANVNGLTIDTTNLIIGKTNPEIKLISAKGNFKDDTAIEIDFGTTGLTKGSISVDENVATVTTTGTADVGLITVKVGAESVETGEELGVAQVGVLYDIEEENENIAWALEEATKKCIPTTPSSFTATVVARRVDFAWGPATDPRYPISSLQYLVTVKGADKEYKILTPALKGYLDTLEDAEYTADIVAVNKDGYQSAAKTIKFKIDNIADATITATTTLLDGSTAGDVVIKIKNSEWLAADVEVDGLESPEAKIDGDTLTLTYANLDGLTAGPKDVTAQATSNKDNIEATTTVEIGAAPEYTATTTMVTGSTAGTVELNASGTKFNTVEAEKKENWTVNLTVDSISATADKVTFNFTGVSASENITIKGDAKVSENYVPVDAVATIGGAPSVEVSGSVAEWTGGTLTLTLTGATFADDVQAITAPSGENVPVVARTGDTTATLTYTNAVDGEITITIPETVIKESVALSDTYTVVDVPVTISATTTLVNEGTDGNIVVTLSNGEYKAEANQAAKWTVTGGGLDGQTPTISVDGKVATLAYTGVTAATGEVSITADSTITPDGKSLSTTTNIA